MQQCILGRWATLAHLKLHNTRITCVRATLGYALDLQQLWCPRQDSNLRHRL